MIPRLVAGILSAVILVAGLTACVPEHDDTSVEVRAGVDASLTSAGGEVTVTLPKDAFTGNGRLSVRAETSRDGIDGWTIELTGAELVGEAHLRFSVPRTDDDEPPPLVASANDPDGELALSDGVQWDGDSAIVHTDHFSFWAALSWGTVLQWARDRLDDIYSADAHDKDPRCEAEDAVRDRGYRVSSDSGNRVKWCLGAGSGTDPVLRVVNARGYAVSAESTPGLTAADTGHDDLVTTISRLFVGPPSASSNAITLIPAGGTLDFTMSRSTTAGVRLKPSVGGYLVSSGQFALDTLGFISPFLGKAGASTKVLLQALELETCFSGFTGMVTADVSNGSEASRLLNDSIGTVLGCLGPAMGRLGLNFAGTVIASGIAWLVSGVRLALNGLGAAADTALNPSGYTIRVTPPTGGSGGGNAEAIAWSTLARSGVCSSCEHTGTVPYRDSGAGSGSVVTFFSQFEVAAVAVDDDGTVPWWGSETVTSPMYEYEAIASDDSGNVFISYNPGRYDGVQVVVPNQGFGEPNRTVVPGSYAPTFAEGHYFAELDDVNDDGIFEIRQYRNDCDPSCAEGAQTSHLLYWTGSRYATQP